jgi:hypothetical protein
MLTVRSLETDLKIFNHYNLLLSNVIYNRQKEFNRTVHLYYVQYYQSNPCLKVLMSTVRSRNANTSTITVHISKILNRRKPNIAWRKTLYGQVIEQLLVAY